ncbi:MAG: hypothetical protein E5V62_03395 [Mesorhizobium sp.]|nr:hypothetical protein EN751_06490 [Mesorhizobium sp. M4A.F.Ca.ET.029.04.2.1]TIW37102.1 MAG: hypothetical protein E5V62_03395 [Mesorhizobium sp.]
MDAAARRSRSDRCRRAGLGTHPQRQELGTRLTQSACEPKGSSCAPRRAIEDLTAARGGAPPCSRAIPGKVCNGFPSGIASKQGNRAVLRFRETVNRSRGAA